MSDSAAFELTVATSQWQEFVRDFARRVVHVGVGESAVTHGNLEFVLATRFADLCDGRAPEECVTIRFPADAALLAFDEASADPPSGYDGQVAVGCFWVSCVRSRNHVTVSIASATRSIAQLMRESDSVRDAFRSLAVHAKDRQVRVVDEWHDVQTL